MSPMEQRIIAIEEKLAYFEKYMGDLNESVIGLARQLDGLRREMARLDTRLNNLGQGEEPSDPRDEKPPHY